MKPERVSNMEAMSFYDELKQGNKSLNILINLIQAVHRTPDLEDIYRVALDLVIELENVDMTMIYLVDEQKQEAILQAYRNLPEDYIRRAGRIPYPKGITWKVINTGRVLNIEDIQKDPNIGPAGRDLGHHGVLGIPIFLEEKVIGVIWFVSYREHEFNQREVNLLSTLGNQIAIAISRAKQTEELEERNSNLSILSMISQAVHQYIDLKHIYKVALDITKDLKFIDIFGVYLVEGEGDKREAVLQIHSGYAEEFLKRSGRIPYRRGVIWKVITSGESVYYENASDPFTPVESAKRALGERALLFIPVKSDSETIGVIHFSNPERTSFTKQELDFLMSLGNQLGTAIAKTKIFEEIKQRKEVLKQSFAQLSKKNRYEAIISTVTRSVHQSMNLQNVLGNAVDAMSKNIDRADNVSIHLVEGEEAVMKAYRGYPDWFIKRIERIPYPKDFTWKTIMDGKSRYCADVNNDRIIGRVGREIGIKSYLCMPVRFGDKTVGALSINSLQKNAFDEEELKLLEIVAQQIEVAINNAQQAEALRESEERYRTLVEHTYDLIIETNTDGRYLYVSPKHKYVLGYEPSELLDKSIFEHIHPDDCATVMAEFQRAAKTLSSGHVVFRYKHKGGEWLWLESTGKPFKTATGEIRAVIASRDITERKRAEESLRESEKQYRDLFENVPTGVYRTNPDGRILMANPALIQMLGYSSFDELALRNLEKEGFEANYPRSQFKELIEREGEVRGLESTWITRYGTVIFVRENTRVIRGEDGTVLYEGTVEDITDRKRAEEELSAAQRRLAFLAEASAILSGSLDYETTLKNVARLAVPEIADWCAVDIVEDGGSLKRLAVTHMDPAKKDLAYEIERRYPTYVDAPYDMPNVLRTSKPELYPEIADSLLVEVARDAEHLQILSDLGLKSAICVPLLAREQRLGVITFVMAESGRRYNSDDLALAEDLARRAAAAIDNAHLYRSTQRAEEQFSSFMRNLPAAAWIKDVEGHYVYANRIGEEIFRTKLSDLIGKTDEEIFPADTAKQFKENDRLVITRGESVQTIETLPQEDGMQHSIVSKFPIFDQNRTMVMVGGVAVDITERIKAAEALRRAHDELEMQVEERTAKISMVNERLRQEIIERNRSEQRQKAQYTVARILAESVTFSEAALKILQVICESLGWELGAIWSVDKSANVLRCIEIWHTPSVEVAEFKAFSLQTTFSLGIGLVGRVWASGQPAWIADVVKDENFPRALSAADEGLHGALAFPIMTENGTIGVIEFFSDEIRQPDEDLLNVTAVIGSQIGQFIERKQAEEELKGSHEKLRALTAHLQSIREEQRTQIAREIHDELGQVLTALKIDLSWLGSQLSKIRKKTRQNSLLDKIQSMSNLIDTTIQAVRRIATELRPGVLDDLGLVAAIEWQAQDFQKRTRIQCELASEDVSLDQELSTAIFRIFQETLTNIARHANATRVNIRLKRDTNNIILEVEDNGRGITEKEISESQSLGLLGMRERALLFGGDIYITGHQGKGTKVAVCIPLER